eukprot:scaffold87030_cov18-Phaeocystis_antarctica.AAC.1
MPTLPSIDLALPACIPGWATGWCHAFSVAAHAATLFFLRSLRDAMRAFLGGMDVDKMWHLLPRDLAFG